MARLDAAGYTSQVRTLLLLMVTSLAGACVVEPVDDRAEIVDDLEVDVGWSEIDAVSDVDDYWPEARRELSCEEHYAECMKSKLGDIDADPGYSRCARCLERCRREDGCWPRETLAGKDCQYDKNKYRKRPQEKIP